MYSRVLLGSEGGRLILYVLAKKLLCSGMVKNGFSVTVVCVITGAEKAIMLEGLLFPNEVLICLSHCLLVSCQAILELLEADAIKLW